MPRSHDGEIQYWRERAERTEQERDRLREECDRLREGLREIANQSLEPWAVRKALEILNND